MTQNALTKATLATYWETILNCMCMSWENCGYRQRVTPPSTPLSLYLSLLSSARSLLLKLRRTSQFLLNTLEEQQPTLNCETRKALKCFSFKSLQVCPVRYIFYFLVVVVVVIVLSLNQNTGLSFCFGFSVLALTRALECQYT